MESHEYNYTLAELLCLNEFKKVFEPIGIDDIVKAITKWAEQEVMSGNGSESLLILASLNLDKTPDVDEFHYYLDRFMLDAGLSYPAHELSTLTWLKIALWKITHCDDVQTAEDYLYNFAICYWDSSPQFFVRTCCSLNWLYYYLFDSYGYQYRTPAEEMAKDELLCYIKKHVSQFERKLHNQDWLDFLVKE